MDEMITTLLGKKRMSFLVKCMEDREQLIQALRSVKLWMEDCLMDIGVDGLPSKEAYKTVREAIQRAEGE